MNTLNAVQMLDAVTKNTKFENVADALEYGLPMSLFGFAIVFGVLVLIWGILALFKVFFYTIPNAKKNPPQPKVKKEAPKPEVKAEPVKVVAAPAPVVQAVSNDGEVVAAIIAAIEAYRSANGATAPGGFRVVSFKKRF
ncbi:MAG: OadG family protein [Clostridia bacterium]|nr:OadG family protein [Clostridia bacterium]